MHDSVTTEIKCIQGKVDIKHAPADLDKAVEESALLNKNNCRLFQSLFDMYEDLFSKRL